MQTFPCHWHPMVEISQLGRHGIENRETRKLVLGTHSGTHMDAPAHFIPNGISIEKIPLDQLVGPASVIDLSDAQPFQAISAKTLEERLNGRELERVILRYDWSDHFGTRSYYTDHPYLMDEAAQWLVDKGCKLIALDAPMPDNPMNGSDSENDSPIHKIVLDAGTVLVEYLTNLRDLRQPTVELVVAPLKIRDGDGSPIRCFAIEYD